jgi:protein involved in polysaccharide export with SLBB domain
MRHLPNRFCSPSRLDESASPKVWTRSGHPTSLLLLLLVIAMATTIGCSNRPRVQTVPHSSPATFSPEEVFTPWTPTSAENIGPGFEVEITSLADATISGSFRVNKDGALSLPYRVELHAAGLTLSELRKNLNSAYAKYIVDPKIDVKITSREYLVEVGGLVNKPGIYSIENTASLEGVLSKAGGLIVAPDTEPRAKYVKITQGRITNLIRLQDYYSGKPGLVPSWRGGERIFPQLTRDNAIKTGSGYIRLLGKVQTPGEYRFQPGKDVYDYLILAGGPSDQANLDEVTLIRASAEGKQSIQFSLKDTSTFPELRAGDAIMFAPESASKLEKGSRVWGAFSGVVSALAGVAALIGIAF